MAQHMLVPPEQGFIDKRSGTAGRSVGDPNTHRAYGKINGVTKEAFVANGAGTTTTIVGADATLASSVNVIRVGERFVLQNSSNVEKENTVFTVTGVASAAGTTTVTFSPAAAGATASGDKAVLVASDPYDDNSTLDARLTAISATTFTPARLDTMTQNDKVYALRVMDDPNNF